MTLRNMCVYKTIVMYTDGRNMPCRGGACSVCVRFNLCTQEWLRKFSYNSCKTEGLAMKKLSLFRLRARHLVFVQFVSIAIELTVPPRCNNDDKPASRSTLRRFNGG